MKGKLDFLRLLLRSLRIVLREICENHVKISYTCSRPNLLKEKGVLLHEKPFVLFIA